MTRVKVADASAIACVLFHEAGAAGMVSALAGSRLVAPALLPYELANVCRAKCRRHPAEREAFLSALRLYPGLNVRELDVDHDGVVQLAVETRLSSYDASYLWLSRSLGADLVTLDQALAAAAAG